jgi:hypothetical protein
LSTKTSWQYHVHLFIYIDEKSQEKVNDKDVGMEAGKAIKSAEYTFTFYVIPFRVDVILLMFNAWIENTFIEFIVCVCELTMFCTSIFYKLELEWQNVSTNIAGNGKMYLQTFLATPTARTNV